MGKSYLLLLMFAVACAKNGAPPPSLPASVPEPDLPFTPTQATSLAKGADWFNYDPDADGLEGVSANLIYQDAAINSSQLAEVIVAVIDSGVDVYHEDLQGKIWNNPGESGLDANGADKASNGIDDDANGYIDDVHGWNFLGGYDKEGKATHVTTESLEMARVFKTLSTKKESGEELSREEEALLAAVTVDLEKETKTSQDRIVQVQATVDVIASNFAAIETFVDFKLDELTVENLTAANFTDEAAVQAKENILAAFKDIKRNDFHILGLIIDYHKTALKFFYNPEYNPRAAIVGDDPSNFEDTQYGNNDVKGPDASHGTHVSGIIAAVRDNGLGVNGIAKNAKIMSLRAVPDGDERDKDVALAVRYAVDNGAKIINMSFGKKYSPYRKQVEDAMSYAAKNGVLLVHAAGNDSKDNDEALSFPARYKANGAGEIATWIEVGASAKTKGEELVAAFSNYGLSSVDVFAPGHLIESTVPENQYAQYSGTSMAAPVVAGSLALMMGLNPTRSSLVQRQLIINRGTRYPGLQVLLPGSDEELVPFANLSLSGSIVNILKAL